MKNQKYLYITLAILVLLVAPFFTAYAAPGEKPQYGGVLKMIVNRAVEALGAPFEGNVWYTTYGAPAMDTLVFKDKNGNIIPWLATAWEIAPDGLAITFTLRKDVKFHDGTEFDAEAVKFNLEKVPFGTVARCRKSIDVLDKYTVRLNLKQSDSSLLGDLTMKNGMIGSPTAIAKPTTPENQARDHMIGTGPFKFVDWERDNYIKFEKFDGYWQKGKPYLDGLEFIYIANPVTASLALQSGAAQMLTRVTPSEANEFKAKGYEILDIPYGVKELTPDGGNSDSPFGDKRVREAVEYAIDRKTISEVIGKGYWIPVNQACVPGHPTSELDIEGRQFNPAKAKELLAEAGYPNGFSTRIIANVEENQEVMAAIQNYLGEVGIKVRLEMVDRGKFVSYNKGGWKNGLVWITVGADTNGPQNVGLLTSSMPYNKSIFMPSDFDSLHQKALAAFEPKKHRELTQQLFRMIHEEAMIIPLWVETQLAAQTKQVHDTGWCEIFFNTFTPADAWLSK